MGWLSSVVIFSEGPWGPCWDNSLLLLLLLLLLLSLLQSLCDNPPIYFFFHFPQNFIAKRPRVSLSLTLIFLSPGNELSPHRPNKQTIITRSLLNIIDGLTYIYIYIYMYILYIIICICIFHNGRVFHWPSRVYVDSMCVCVCVCVSLLIDTNTNGWYPSSNKIPWPYHIAKDL